MLFQCLFYWFEPFVFISDDSMTITDGKVSLSIATRENLKSYMRYATSICLLFKCLFPSAYGLVF